MRFLVDECTGPAVAQWLRNQQYEVFSVYEEARGMNDDTIIQKAFAENWIRGNVGTTNNTHYIDWKSSQL